MPKAKTTKNTKALAGKPKKSTKDTGVKTKGAKPTKEKKTPPPTAPCEKKQVIIAQFQVKQGDTGSPEVLTALLSNRIEKLIAHLKTNPADNHSRRGLLGIVSKRRRLLNYLEKKNSGRYKEISQKLGLSK